MNNDEAREKDIAEMGPELGPVYHELSNECAWLHLKWQEFVELYGTQPERIDLLNAAAGVFFRVVQDALWDDTMLHLARLTDRTESFGKTNLTLLGLPALIGDAEFREEIQSLVKEARSKTDFARDWRNRRIAHRDLSLALQQHAEPLAQASRLQVKEALSAISAVLKRISQHCTNADLTFDVIAGHGDAESLLYVIRDGLEADERRRARLRDGNINPEDLRPPRVP